MYTLKVMIALFVAAGLGVGTFSAFDPGGPSSVEAVDFGEGRNATDPVFDPAVEPVSRADLKVFRIPITHETIEIAPGVRYNGWTFGGTVPGPTLRVREGDRVRFFVVNAGPSLQSHFHIVGAVFDRVYPDGNPENALRSVQTYTVPPGGGAVFETTFAEGGSGQGVYAFVTHAFADAAKGAMGLIQVGTPELVAGRM